MSDMRINRALAAAGVASRRTAEEYIRAGRVRLNGAVVSDLATRVDPRRDELMLDGRVVKISLDYVYFIYNKPRGQVSTMTDERGRPCVGDVCRDLPGQPRLVGRLDRASEGLMLLTTDGELANRLTHPRYGVKKAYQVAVQPVLTTAAAGRLVQGVELEDGPAALESITLLEASRQGSLVEVVISEGRNRLIRRCFAAIHYEVRKLKRVRLGTLQLGRLKTGQTRPLNGREVADLKQLVKL
ncbi:rRNA pseudouridine synthase [bacterium]|nr:rRNA pseudouridine synthase [bacterium]